MIIGLGVILYMFFRQVELEELGKINWNLPSFTWILIAIISYSLRHVLYSWRLRILSDRDFGWMKSIELVTILEFASAVSPTNFGGSAVAFFLLIQESIEGARATAIVLYTIIVDTLFFAVTIPIFYVLFGRNFFMSGTELKIGWGGLEFTLLIVWLIMVIYGGIMTYGLFVRPVHLKRILYWFSKLRIFGKTKDKIRQAGRDIEVSSRELNSKPISFHINLGLITLMAWIFRFFTVSAILLALNPGMPQTIMDHITLLGRGEALYAITAYSPTPGGSGVAELIFGQFYAEYISPGIAVVAAFIWRMITYYPYLILGVIIIPMWFRKLLIKRQLAAQISN